MSPDAQRIAIAEACGWKFARDPQTWYPPNLLPAQNVMGYTLPDYLTDLNAMHEAENSLPVLLRSFYCDWLMFGRINPPQKDTKIYGRWQTVNATAAQRAEAFLRATNLWTN